MTRNLFAPAPARSLLAGLKLENPDTLPEPLKITRKIKKNKSIAAMRKEKLADFFSELPGPGEATHIISNGCFDYWNFCPVTLDMLGTPAELYASTWTMNRGNAVEMLELIDTGRLTDVALLSGLYFKRRETAVYTTIARGLLDRGQRFLCFENHSKIFLIRNARHSIVIQGSANFTANPRVENTVIIDDAVLYDFHKEWIEKLLAKNGQKRKAAESR